MKFKFELDTEQSAIDLIRHWTHYWTSYKESDFGLSNEHYFHGAIDFHRSKADFYSTVIGHMRNNNLFSYFVDNNSERINQGERIISRDAFIRSGASDCLRILLWAYYDIYSKEDSDNILREIYNQMTRDPEDDFRYDVPSSHFERLRPYMSNAVINDITRICRRNTHDVEWATESMATWAYSFWARRHNDRVDRTVYRVLKILERIY